MTLTYNVIHLPSLYHRSPVAMENRTSRLTILIDPKKKALFEELCAKDDVTPSQMVRKLIRDYIESKMGPAWRDSVFAENGGVDQE